MDASNPIPNFIVLVAGIALYNECRDDLNDLTDTRISNRQNLDSHCLDKKNRVSKGLLC